MEMYGVERTGGSIGEKSPCLIAKFSEKNLAIAYAKRMRRILTPGEKGYYHIRYRTVKLKGGQ